MLRKCTHVNVVSEIDFMFYYLNFQFATELDDKFTAFILLIF